MWCFVVLRCVIVILILFISVLLMFNVLRVASDRPDPDSAGATGSIDWTVVDWQQSDWCVLAHPALVVDSQCAVFLGCSSVLIGASLNLTPDACLLRC